MSCDHGHRPLHYPIKRKEKKYQIKKNVQVLDCQTAKCLEVPGGDSVLLLEQLTKVYRVHIVHSRKPKRTE